MKTRTISIITKREIKSPEPTKFIFINFYYRKFKNSKYVYTLNDFFFQANNMIFLVGYPEELLNDTLVEKEYYKNVSNLSW